MGTNVYFERMDYYIVEETAQVVVHVHEVVRAYARRSRVSLRIFRVHAVIISCARNSRLCAQSSNLCAQILFCFSTNVMSAICIVYKNGLKA